MKTLATLGPSGSDSEEAARTLARELQLDTTIILLGSFEAALHHASQHDGLALLPAAYQSNDDCGHVCDTWADTHFRVETAGQLELWQARVLPLKPLALAIRRDRDLRAPSTVALHPATRYYAATFLPGARPLYYPSKPEAVRACAAGEADACIGSADVVARHPELVATRTFSARMCWTLYRRAAQAAAQPMVRL